MKTQLIQLLSEAVTAAQAQGKIKEGVPVTLETPRQSHQGDFSTPLAMSLAKENRTSPRELALLLVSLMQESGAATASGATHVSGATPAGGAMNPAWPSIEKVEVAGPGYINFFLKKGYWDQTVLTVHREKELYGHSGLGAGRRVLIEFVSANPTGPLHVAHGRSAALGDALVRLLRAAGFCVETEYYINDMGGQMNLLGLSTYLRYRELFGETITLPEEGYRGDYLIEIAEAIKESEGDRYLMGAKEGYLPYFRQVSYDTLLAWLRRDLLSFGIHYDHWISEEGLQGEVASSLEFLKANGTVYENEGALWVATSRYGDDKDRVVVRNNGQKTYFASDIAYHKNKYERGYDRLINIWGADHHGYIQRVKAAMAAIGYDPERLTILTHQLVNLLREGKPVPMSKRSGEFVTLKEVMEEVGVDATRFFFLMRRADTAVDFDLELAKKASNENPVYYVQYACARLSSIVRTALAQGVDVEAMIQGATPEALHPLSLPIEKELMKQLAFFPDLIVLSAEMLEPHRLTAYLQELSGMFHRYYYDHRVVTDDPPLTRARLILITAIHIVLKNALSLLGIRAIEKM